MAFQATLTISCLKQHACAGCGCRYSYVLNRKVVAQGNTEQQAVRNAEARVARAVEREVEFRPCPQCGRVQPEMVAPRRSARYWWGMVLGLAAVVTALILGAAHAVPIQTSACLAAGGAGLALLVYLRGLLYDPNRAADANLATAQARLADGTLSLDERGGPAQAYDPDAGPRPGGSAFGHTVALVFALGAVAAAAAPVLLAAANAWPLNATTYPAVAGPGDTARVYFDDSLTSVQGMWRGPAAARVANAGELKLPRVDLPASTKGSLWGMEIRGESVNNSTNRMYAEVTVPADAALAGKTLRLDLSVNASFPFRIGDGFQNNNKLFRHSADVTLAAPGAGASYFFAWWAGQLGAMVLIVFAGAFLLMANAGFRKSGRPTRVAPIHPGPGQ